MLNPKDCIGKNVLVIHDYRDVELQRGETPEEGVITAITDDGRSFRLNGRWLNALSNIVLQEIAPEQKKEEDKERVMKIEVVNLHAAEARGEASCGDLAHRIVQGEVK